jgi:hypothetical protein
MRTGSSVGRRLAAAVASAGLAFGLTGTMVLTTTGTAHATESPGTPCNKLGFPVENKTEGASGSDTVVVDGTTVGSITWGDRVVEWDLAEGWTIEICVKGGSTDPYEIVEAAGSGSYTHEQGISHVAWRVLTRPEEPTDGGEEPTDEPEVVTPVAPTVSPSEKCEVPGSYTIPDTAGVGYLLDGEPLAPGTYDGPEMGEITAIAVGEAVLKNPGWSYDLRVDKAAECPEEGGGVTPTEGGSVDGPRDRCPNLPGAQSAVPGGLVMVDGDCVKDKGETGTDRPGTTEGPTEGTTGPTGGATGPQTTGETTGPQVAPEPADQVLGASGGVPTAVDAGVGDRESASGVPAMLLVAGGLLLTLTATTLRARRRELGGPQG